MKPAWLVLLLALVVGTLVRLEAPRSLHIDETASFLAATCKQREYAALRAKLAPPFAHWAPSSDWQAFLVPSKVACLREISRGLAETDLHPPLYFWILHFWIYLVPPSLATGPSLNAPLALGTAWLLFLLAKDVFRRPLPAALAVLAWAVNPCGLEVTHFARPYELLGLLSTLLAWRSVRWVHEIRADALPWREGLVLFGVSLAGVLTHYSFVFVAVAAGVYLLFGLGLKRAVAPGVSLVLGIVASNAFHPTFASMLFGPHERTATGTRTKATATLLTRILAFFDFNFDAVAEARRVHVWIAAAVLVALATATIWFVVAQRRAAERAVDLRFLLLPAALVALLAAGMAFGLVPVHAARPRHLAFLWPLFAVVVAYPFALAPFGDRPAFFAVAGAGLVLSAASLASLPSLTNPWPRERGSRYAGCERLVVPGTRRTSTLRAVLHLDPGVLVFAGSAPEVDRMLSEEPQSEVCLGKGEDLHRVERVLAKHHVSIPGSPQQRGQKPAKHRKTNAAPGSPDDDNNEDRPEADE